MPYPQDYRPKLDILNELDADEIIRYQQLVGTLRWSIEPGLIDINTDINCLSQQLLSTQEGHPYAVYHIYLIP